MESSCGYSLLHLRIPPAPTRQADSLATARESLRCSCTYHPRIPSCRSPQVGTAAFTMKNKRKRAEPVIEPVDEAEEVAELEQQVVATAPARGTQPFTESSGNRQPFTALPLSQRTTLGLNGGGFKTMTEIQVSVQEKLDSPVLSTDWQIDHLVASVQRLMTNGTMNEGVISGHQRAISVSLLLTCMYANPLSCPLQ